MFSLCQVTFTVGRFVGVVILRWIDPALLFTFHAVMCVIASICVATLKGWTSVGFLYVLFFYESICYPVSRVLQSGDNTRLNKSRLKCIFTLATKNLGVFTKRGSGLIVMVSLLLYTALLQVQLNYDYFRASEEVHGTRLLKELSQIVLPRADRT